MVHAGRTRFLHVANGSSTTATIDAAGIPGALSIWADPLHDGPVPGGLSDAELLDVRSRHLAGGSEAANVDPVNDLRNWRRVIEAHDAYDELILWYEHDLFDQLNLIQLLPWIKDRVPHAKAVSLICIDSFPGRPRFKGLGELSPQELSTLLDTRQPVTDAQYTLAGLAWSAFREPTPGSLDDFRRRDLRALPYLAAAMTRFLEEYPWLSDGLSRSERRLMELASAGTTDLAVMFPRMHDGESAYYVTYETLVELAESLSGTTPPLLTAPSRPHLNGGLSGSIAITDFGRDVLGRRADRVATCGIDRWFGGVHLQGRSHVWRWDPDLQRITRS